jgi:hypothetical protein
MVDLGNVTLGPLDRSVLVGPFSLEEGDDTLWVNITQISPQQEWNFSYALLWWESSDGRQLGTQKVYGEQLGEIFRFGVGLAPVERDGRIYIAPRAYNRRWISIDNPPEWVLNFEATSGYTGTGTGPPAFGIRATLGTLANLANVRIPYEITDGIAYLTTP